MNNQRISEILNQLLEQTREQVLPTVYSATMLAGLQELQGLTAGIEAQRAFAQADWKLVPVERIQIALEAVQNATLDAYSNAYQECCGRGQGQCCGDPDPAWSAEDQRIMDALSPAQRELSALLAAAPAAPVAQEPVAWVCTARKPGITEQRSLWHGEQGADTWLAHFAGRGCEVTKTPPYTAPPAAEQPFRMLSAEEIAVRELLAAMNRDGGQHQHSVGIAQAAKDALTEFSRLQQTLAEQPDAVKVPRKVLENWLDSADERERPRFVHVLRALLAGGAE